MSSTETKTNGAYVALPFLIAFALPALIRADELRTFDGRTLSGRIEKFDDRAVVFRDESRQPNTLVAVPVADLLSVRLRPPPPPLGGGSILVVDNDRGDGVREASGKIKLKQGHHKFHLAWWHVSGPPTLQLEYEGPGVQRTAVAQPLIFSLRAKASEEEASPGLDEMGFRRPDKPGDQLDNRAAWRLHEWERLNAVRDVADIRTIPLTRRGKDAAIHPGVQHHAGPYALVFSGYLQVPGDGEFTFHLKSDGGSQLFFGAQPQRLGPIVNAPRPVDWSVKFAGGGELVGDLKSWEDSAVDVQVPLGSRPFTLTLAPAAVRELWTHPVHSGALNVDRAGEPADEDSVYAKNKDDQVQRVSGRVVGIRDAALRFVYQDQERTIAMERVVGIVLRESPAPELDGFHYLVRLPGPHRIPARCKGIDANNVRLETVWGHPLTLKPHLVAEMDVVNGRVVWLSELAPSRVEQTPWFDRVIPYRLDQSATGSALRIAEKSYDRGLSTHSRTVLEYDLARGFERFRCEVGLQHPEGELGRASVRILADDGVLFELPDLTARTPAQPVDLDVAGRSKLTLEVDFGQHFDVGDHVVWGDAQLVRPATSSSQQ
jgi:hypothetical protein